MSVHPESWFGFSLHSMRPDYVKRQIHRWRLRFGPIEVRGWRKFVTPAKTIRRDDDDGNY
jgi:hypothetical protein